MRRNPSPAEKHNEPIITTNTADDVKRQLIARKNFFIGAANIPKLVSIIRESPGLAALQLAFHLTEVKRLINDLQMQDALAAIDRAIDSLYKHSEFRSVSRDMFLTAIEGELTPTKKNCSVN